MTGSPRLNILTIAGSDSGGASGVQADLKTFARLGLHGLSAITAITAQSLDTASGVGTVTAATVERQLRALFDGFDIAAVKLGMLGSAPIVATVARILRQVRARNIVLDPVIASSSGAPLLSARGLAVLRDDLLPMATVLTPNLPEAALLLRHPVRTHDLLQSARELFDFGPQAVLIKGGHGSGRVVRDVLVDADGVREFRHPRLHQRARGTGCVLASAIASGLAQRRSIRDAIAGAEAFLQVALQRSYQSTRSRTRILDIFAKT
jgi:hydroxymethylpyrimidine/phosphomethylpyrimidine kinase